MNLFRGGRPLLGPPQFVIAGFALAVLLGTCLLMLLMFVGGGTGSCAGGIKVSTLSVLAALAWRHLRGQTDANLWGRRVPDGTVGLSTGVTPGLTTWGKLLVTFLMFAGRVGPLTLASLLQARRPSLLRYPEEDLGVG